MERGSPLPEGLAQPRAHARAIRAARRLGLVLAAGAALLAAMAPASAQPPRPLTAAEEPAVEHESLLVAEPVDPAPGEVVVLTGEGFPPHAEIEVGAGPPASQYEVLDHSTSDAEGRVLHEVQLPLRAEPGQIILFVMATEDFSHKAVSNPVVITATAEPAVAAVN